MNYFLRPHEDVKIRALIIIIIIINFESLSAWEYSNVLRCDLYLEDKVSSCQRPNHVENTGSRLITAVKQLWARSVLGWVTAWENHVLLVFFFSVRNFLVTCENLTVDCIIFSF